MWHPRLGLIGWVAYCSGGHIDTAVHMVANLITQLNINERVQAALPPTTSGREVETNAKMVDLLKDAVTQMKRPLNDQQRIEYHIALGLVMPPRDSGWISRICDRLGVPRGTHKRSVQDHSRRFAADKAVDRRAQFDLDVKTKAETLVVGDKVCVCVCVCVYTVFFLNTFGPVI